MLSIDLTGTTTIVAGGSRGIGAAIVAAVAQAGGQVAWTHWDPDDTASDVLAMRVKEHGAECLFERIDCTDTVRVRKFVDAVAREWGGINHLVYCAGFTSPVPFLDLNAEEWRRVVDINLNGAFYATHAVIPHMQERGGAIVLIGSAAIVAGGGGRADYVSAKAGLCGLNRAIAKQFGPTGIRCNLVHPSLVDTDLLRQRHPDAAARQSLVSGVPLRRLGRPEDLAHITVFLLSDLASYITAEAIFVDGGRTFCK